jgi:phosphoglycolate phosphatase
VGRSDSEIFFEALALNDVPMAGNEDELLVSYFRELEAAFAQRSDQLRQVGKLMPGARTALAAAAAAPGIVQSVLTGTIRPNAVIKLRAFGLDQFLDLEIGGYGSDAYPRGSLLLMARTRAQERCGSAITADSCVYIADSCRDIEAAKIGGARSIAVATGRDTAAELRDAGADLVLTDLSETGQVISAIDRFTGVPAQR